MKRQNCQRAIKEVKVLWNRNLSESRHVCLDIRTRHAREQERVATHQAMPPTSFRSQRRGHLAGSIGRFARSTVSRVSGGNKQSTSSSSSSSSSPTRKFSSTVSSSSNHSAPLATFDACIEACDALAASSSLSSSMLRQQQHDSSTNCSNYHDDNDDEDYDEDDEIINTNEKQTHRADSSNAIVPDCSILVSPDGALLFTLSQQASYSTSLCAGGGGSIMQDDDDDDDFASHGNVLNKNAVNVEDRYPWTKITPDNNHQNGAIILDEEYTSAIICGNDLTPNGDYDSNGFSARGWDQDAATNALYASRDVLLGMETFVAQLATVEKESASVVLGAVEKLRDHCNCIPPRSGRSSSGLGPMLLSGTNLHTALLAMEEYYESTSVNSLERWRMACSPTSSRHNNRSDLFNSTAKVEEKNGNGLLFSDNNNKTDEQLSASSTKHPASPPELIRGMLHRLQTASTKATTRTTERDRALSVVRSNIAEAENILRGQKEWAHSQWQRVVDEERNIDRLYLLKKMEQQEEWNEQQRKIIERSRSDDDSSLHHQNSTTNVVDFSEEGPLSREVWEIVQGVESAEEFTHTGYSPRREQVRNPKVLDIIRQRFDSTGHAMIVDLDPNQQQQQQHQRHGVQENCQTRVVTSVPSSRQITRLEVERESDIADIRRVAMAADESVEDAADKLLNMMSKADTTNRSARLATETCLLSECNGAADCLRALVAIERANLDDRLRQLAVFETAVNAIDVRKDIDKYITADKATSSGRSAAGDDDDGGVAAALAVLNSHCESGDGDFAPKKYGNIERPNHFEGWTFHSDDDDNNSNNDDDVQPEIFEDVIKMLFEDTHSVHSVNEEGSSEGHDSGSSSSSSRRRGSPQLWNEEKLSSASDALAEQSKRGELFRKSILYELNNQRSKKTKIDEPAQFDALCGLFNSFLAGCGREANDVSNTKMLMILSQTFYTISKVVDGMDGRDIYQGSTTKDRQSRIYVKSSIVHHDIWSDDDFWDTCLYQCVSESLLKSGVLMNYVNASVEDKNRTTTRKIDTKEIKWHDLSPNEYAGAASQVHSVVFAQLGTLSRECVEFVSGNTYRCSISNVHLLSLSSLRLYA